MPIHTSPTQDCRGLWCAIVDYSVPSHEYANLFRGHPSDFPYPTLHLTFTACQCHPQWLVWPMLTKSQNPNVWNLVVINLELWQILQCVLLARGLNMAFLWIYSEWDVKCHTATCLWCLDILDYLLFSCIETNSITDHPTLHSGCIYLFINLFSW